MGEYDPREMKLASTTRQTEFAMKGQLSEEAIKQMTKYQKLQNEFVKLGGPEKFIDMSYGLIKAAQYSKPINTLMKIIGAETTKANAEGVAAALRMITGDEIKEGISDIAGAMGDSINGVVKIIEESNIDEAFGGILSLIGDGIRGYHDVTSQWTTDFLMALHKNLQDYNTKIWRARWEAMKEEIRAQNELIRSTRELTVQYDKMREIGGFVYKATVKELEDMG